MAALFRLRCFGGLSLVGADGAVAAPAQRKRLALLAILATGGAAGVPRDRVVSLLWPESDEERANAALHQLVYALKRDIGPAIVSAGTDLLLDPDVVASDAAEFLTALDGGDLDTAVAAYAGSFLDGIFLRGLPGFERWVDQQRARLAERYVGALETLADRAEQRQDFGSAAAHWRKIVAADALQSRSVLRLMRVLERADDAPAALQIAAVHGKLVEAELGLAVDPRIDAFARELRARANARPSEERTLEVLEAPRVAERTPELSSTGSAFSPSRGKTARLALTLASVGAMLVLLAVRAHPSIAPGTGTWVDVGRTPAPIAQAAAGLVGSIDVFGGSGGGPGVMTSAAWSFDFVSRRWSPLPSLPSSADLPAPRSWRATNVAAIGSKIYLAGGNYPGFCTADAKSYEPATGRWGHLAPLPVALCHAVTIAAQGRLYVIGGTNTSGDVYNAAVFVYEPGLDRWRTAAAPMPYALLGAAAAVEGATIYVIGGSINGGECSRKVVAFETVTERWSIRDSLSTPRCEAGAAQVDGRIYAIGGLSLDPRIFSCRTRACGDRFSTTLRSVESYDPETNLWRREADLPVASAGMVAVAVPGHFFVIGGYDHEQPVNRVFEYVPR